MNSKVESFLDSVCTHIKYKAAHKDIRDELTNHIYELKNTYLEYGVDEEKALEMAISAMGNCDEIGNDLNKRHKPQTEWSLIGFTAIIAVIGGIVMFTSSKFDSYQAVDFNKYLLYAAVGIGVLIGVYFFDYTKLKKMALPAYLTAHLLIFYTLISGTGTAGRRFLTIGGFFSISANYLSILFLVAIAGLIEKSRGKGGTAVAGVTALAFISLIPIMALPDFSVAFILSVCYVMLILSSVLKNHYGGNKKIQLISLVGFGILAISFGASIIVSSAYRINRMINFITFRSNPMGSGYQPAMADKWLTASNFFGKAPDVVQGFNIHSILPGVNREYVLVNVIATLGWIVGIIVIFTAAAFIFRMIMTTAKTKNNFGFYLSLGACSLLSAQFIIGILVNFNLFPLLTVGIPFISYGGTGYVVNMAFVGIILSVWRRNNLVETSTKTLADSSKKFVQVEDGKLIISFR